MGESTNTTVDWFDWAPGEPNDYHRQQCLVYIRYDYFGVSAKCAYICHSILYISIVFRTPPTTGMIGIATLLLITSAKSHVESKLDKAFIRISYFSKFLSYIY